MPQVVVGAALAGLAAGSWVAGGALIVGFSLSAFAGSLILGGLSYALTPKPKRPRISGLSQNNTVAVRQSDIVRKQVYGHTRIVSGFAHMEATGTNDKLHLMIMLCEGELRAINEVWVNDYAIPNDWIDEDGNVIEGRYKDKMVIRKHLGSPTQEADQLAVDNLPEWTTDHRLQGIAYLYLILTKDQDIYPNGLPNFSAIVEGKPIYDPREGDAVFTTNTALFAADYLRNTTYGFGVEEDDLDYTNVAAQANICDEMVTVTAKNYQVDGVDTDLHLLTVTGDFLDLCFGDRVEVSSSGDLPDGLLPNTEYYVIPYQIKDTLRFGLATSLRNALDKVYIEFLDEGDGEIVVTKTGEPRYHASGVIETDVELTQNLNNICSSMAGRAINVGGAWTLLAGAWRTPATSYGVGDMRGYGMSFRNDLSMAECFNVVKGLFVSPITSYQASDYPAAKYNQFIEQDNGIEYVRELNLPFTNRPDTAQRIAKIELFRGRQGIVFNSEFSMKMLQNQCGDNVYLDVDRLGWASKPFEITDFSFDVNEGNLVSRVTMRETAQEIFDWSAGEAIGFDPAPNTNLPNPFQVQVPTGVGYDSRITDTRDGDVVYTMTLRWNTHPDQFVRQFGDFEIQYKLSSEDEWRPSFFVDGALTKTDVVNSSVGVPYDLRIRARNNLGVRSAFVTIVGAVVGSSGGVTTSIDYGSVADPVGSGLYEDWGSVADPVGSGNEEDWGFVV